MTTALCPLDKEYEIDVEVADSPMFADLLTHWGGDSETVAELQGHLYQEVIELVRVEQHVFTFRQEPGTTSLKYDSSVQEQLLAYNNRDVEATMAMYRELPPEPTVTFTVHETGPMQAIKIDEPVVVVEDENFEHFDKIDTAWNLEAIRLRKRHFRRTRIFFKMVWAAYKTARAS
jgi:hypothetical protein